MIKALLIAPYPGLAETAKKIDTPADIQLDVTIANLEEGAKAAQLAEKQGYELIISRGGTASMIQDVVSIPVVHIDITGYDMLRVFTLIRGIKKGVALVGYANISQGAATICNILEFDVKMITIQSRDEVRDHLETLKQEGFAVVIGDVITVQVAEQIGLRGVLITSGKEAVMDALEEGKRVYNFFRRVNNHFYHFQEAFHSFPYPTVLLNGNGEVIDKNLLYEQDNQLSEVMMTPAIATIIKRVLEFESTQWAQVEGNNAVYEIQAYLVSKTDAIVGVTIHSILSNTQAKAISVMNHPVHKPIIGSSEQAERLRRNIATYAKSDEIISIIGEQGTGRFTIAQEIHFERFGQRAPIIVIDGKKLPKEISELADIQDKLVTFKQGTILVKDVNSISVERQDSFHNIVRTIPKSLKVIVTSSEPLDALVQDGSLDENLYQKIAAYPLHLSPLRARKEDIGEFVDYFLTELHAENGNETVGMKSEAVAYLKQFDWGGNLFQLKKVVRELSLMSTSNYIELSHVEELMDNYNRDGASLALDGTLEEIEQKIITQVLKEEGNNQSKAASRLGINRSTLWRKLKQ